MRIIAGKYKGRKLVAPKGLTTRPTASRHRESLFNIIADLEGGNFWQGKTVLDLFAGSGALGLEALSRGAAKAIFVDNSVDALEGLAKNIKNLALEDKTKLIKADINQAGFILRNIGACQAFDVIFADPPYAKGYSSQTLLQIEKYSLAKKLSYFILEESTGENIEMAPWLELIKKRAYGKSCFYICRINFPD